jgi:uncharacterized protein (DUF2147 family)
LKAKELKARFATLVLAGLAVLAAVATPAHAQQPSAAGLWQKLDEDTHQPVIWFLFVERGGVYEGYAVRTFPRPGEDPNPVCTRCTDDRKGMPLLGLPMIRGMKRVGLRYEDGTILDPRDGKVYSAVMRLDPAQGTLTLHGYVLGIELFGKDDVWNRVPDSGFREIDPALLAKLAPERVQGQNQKGKAKSPQR